MKNILNAPFVKEMCDVTANMYRLGWDERNGGNISYLLDEKEVAEYLDLSKVIREIPTGFTAKSLVGKIFIVTGTGKYFKNVAQDPETNLGIIRIKEDAELEMVDKGVYRVKPVSKKVKGAFTNKQLFELLGITK